MDLSIQIDHRSLNQFNKAMRDQVPYAVAVALTRTAAQARDKVREEMPRRFMIRNQFTKNSVRFQRAEKRDWPNPKAIVGTIAPYMAIQEDGGEKSTTAKAFSIPKGIRSSERKLVSRSKWPGKILAPGKGSIPMGGRTKGARAGSRTKPKPFLLKEQGGVGVYVRIGRSRALKRLYRITRQTMHVTGRHWLTEPVNQVVAANLATNFEKAFLEAIRSRR